jgi:UDP-N-acetylmuramoyl-L-alanyl-D-glutamate--2,6-diaminopimelate ligase
VTLPGHGSPSPLAEVNRSLGLNVAELSADSRRVRPGVTFAAFPGERADGRSYIAQALQAGANAVLWEAHEFAWRAQWSRPNLGIVNLRDRVGLLAAELHGHPSHAMQVFGITGTNGKTSCSQWLAQCLNAAGKPCGVIGTLGNGLLGKLQVSANTTPDPIVLQATLAQLLREGAQAVSMEVSSHGLAQGRVNGTLIDVALFTNLSRDHLDYHGDMESYFAAKAKLFALPQLRAAVINLDDAYGVQLARQLLGRGVRIYGYGWQQADAQLAAQLHYVRAEALQVTGDGVSFTAHAQQQRAHVRAAVLGAFNAQNLLGVLSCLLASGFALDEAARLASSVLPVTGRMQRVGGAGKPLAVIDYAHTPDALEKVLSALRASVAPGARLSVVFGCGGDRDRGKRALMGAVAAHLADRVVVTSDNPRSEPPRRIIDDILQGVGAAGIVESDRAAAIAEVESDRAAAIAEVESDRAAAIAVAIAQAGAHDIVLIAGKGHEDYQEIAGQRLPFSDLAHARAAIERWPE